MHRSPAWGIGQTDRRTDRSIAYRIFPSGRLSQTLNLAFFLFFFATARRMMTRLTTVAIYHNEHSPIVYNTTDVTHSLAHC